MKGAEIMAKKKFGKVLLCGALISSAVAGGIALYNKYKDYNSDLDDDDFLDFDDDDFDDNDFDDDFDNEFDDIIDDDFDDDFDNDSKNENDTAGENVTQTPDEENDYLKADNPSPYVSIPSGDDFASSELEAENDSNDIGFDNTL